MPLLQLEVTASAYYFLMGGGGGGGGGVTIPPPPEGGSIVLADAEATPPNKKAAATITATTFANFFIFSQIWLLNIYLLKLILSFITLSLYQGKSSVLNDCAAILTQMLFFTFRLTLKNNLSFLLYSRMILKIPFFNYSKPINVIQADIINNWNQ